ncbi:hypothetical protein JL720_17314 [Aureococcus anophagefferens]|nr:hypothetical protein JL720_17314 [Aureococcus anophagefferens]
MLRAALVVAAASALRAPSRLLPTRAVIKVGDTWCDGEDEIKAAVAKHPERPLVLTVSRKDPNRERAKITFEGPTLGIAFCPNGTPGMLQPGGEAEKKVCNIPTRSSASATRGATARTRSKPPSPRTAALTLTVSRKKKPRPEFEGDPDSGAIKAAYGAHPDRPVVLKIERKPQKATPVPGDDPTSSTEASRALMERLAPQLRSHWSRAAAHLPAAAPEVASLSLAHFDDHVDAGGFLGASRSAPSADSGWAVGVREGGLALDDRGTLVLNGASDTVPALASLALASLDALALPSTINGYATRAGEPVAAAPRADFQEVVCLQCTGRQRWRAWRPPKPLGDALGAALALGKGRSRSRGPRCGASDAALADAAVALPFDALTDVRACAAALGGGDRGRRSPAAAAPRRGDRRAPARPPHAVGDAPAAWARRWRRWARDSTREVLAHNAFIATGAREAPDFMDDAAFDACVDRAFEVQGVVI